MGEAAEAGTHIRLPPCQQEPVGCGLMGGSGPAGRPNKACWLDEENGVMVKVVRKSTQKILKVEVMKM